MAEQHRSRIYLVTLILCLCIGSLAFLDIMRTTSPSLVGFIGLYSDQHVPSPKSDLAEEILLFALAGTVFIVREVLKFKPVSLDFRSICLSPHFPPPKAN